MGEIRSAGWFEGPMAVTAASAPCCGATSTRTAAGGAAATDAARATRTRLPSCSISISFNPVSSRSWVSSWINSRSMMVFDDFAIAWRSIFLFRAQQASKARNCQGVAIDAKAGDHRFCCFRNVGVLPEALARVNIRNVHFDHRQLYIHGKQRVHDGDRRGRIACGVDDDGCRVLGVRLLNPVD